MNKGHGLRAEVRLFIAFIFVFINIVISVININKDEIIQQSLYSHLFGAISGLLIGIAVLKNISTNKSNSIMSCVGCSLYVIMLTIFIEYNLIKSYLND